MYWFLHLSFYHIGRDQNNLLGQFILSAALADCAGKCALWKAMWKGAMPRRRREGRAGKRCRGARSASCLLCSPQGGRVRAPLVAGCGSMNVPCTPHIHHFHLDYVLSQCRPFISSVAFLHLACCVCVGRWGQQVWNWVAFSRQTMISKAFSVATVWKSFFKGLFRQLAKQGLRWRKHTNNPFYPFKRRKVYLKSPLLGKII